MPRTSGPSKPPVDPELRMFTVSLVVRPGVRLSMAACTAEMKSVPVNTVAPLTRAVNVVPARVTSPVRTPGAGGGAGVGDGVGVGLGFGAGAIPASQAAPAKTANR